MTTPLPQPQTARVNAKLKHVAACLLPESQYQKSAGFETISLNHEAAAGLRLSDICLTTQLLHKTLSLPLMIAPMTGGMELGAVLNQRWARAAEHFGFAFGVGSQRLALEDAQVAQSFKVRTWAPTCFLFGNLGAAQLVHEHAIARALAAVRMIEADALFIHVNPLQEACQKNGDLDFSRLLQSIERIVNALGRENIPVFVREVGFGLSEEAARAFISTGVAGLDCSGAGGTSWSKVESLCSEDEKFRRLGAIFGEWGIPTVTSIKNVRAVDSAIPLIASGGIRSGLDVAKSLALGANIAAMAQPMLHAAMTGEDELFAFIEQVAHELRVAMFATGASTIAQLSLKLQEKP